MLLKFDAAVTVCPGAKQFTVIAVVYDTPVPSGKKVVPDIGGVQLGTKGVIATVAPRLAD